RRRHTRWPRDWSSDVCSSDHIVEHPDRVRMLVRDVRDDAQSPAHGAARWRPHRVLGDHALAPARRPRLLGRRDAAGMVLDWMVGLGIRRPVAVARSAATSARARRLPAAACLAQMAALGQSGSLHPDLRAGTLPRALSYCVTPSRL